MWCISYILEETFIYFLIYNVIYYNLLLNMITVGKVSMMIDFQENIMPLLHGVLQFHDASSFRGREYVGL